MKAGNNYPATYLPDSGNEQGGYNGVGMLRTDKHGYETNKPKPCTHQAAQNHGIMWLTVAAAF
jgi:hypothetical protein